MKRQLIFASVEEAVSVLGKYTTEARLRAMEALGFDLADYRQEELGKFVHASREKVNRAMIKMGYRRRAVAA